MVEEKAEISPVPKKKNRSNLHSPTSISSPCTIVELDVWFRSQVPLIANDAEGAILLQVYVHLDQFVRWPTHAMLLWSGRTRAQKYHKYPQSIQYMARMNQIGLDGRVNGPAVAAFRLAGGERPSRIGSNNGWSIHHLYSGKFPYPGRASTTHAAWEGLHCTQSAGLVAVHPIADQMCDEYPCFSWLLRAMAFQKFDYDPDGVFSTEPHDEKGFVGKSCLVVPGTEGVTAPVQNAVD